MKTYVGRFGRGISTVHVIIVIICFAASPLAHAQVKMDSLRKESPSKVPGSIFGVLIDSTTNKPVSFGSIAVISKEADKMVTGTISDQNGKFQITGLNKGEYRLEYSFIGYKTVKGNYFQLTNEARDMGTIFLSPDTKLLNEVTVVGMSELVEEKVDRLVYNATKDASSKGGNAADVLRKVPLLTVNLDGNVSLKGSQNVKVLINNKPSTIVSSSIANALKQIPADLIQSVEVITSPSAKYDAEGSAGIINIITKKNSLDGGSLNIDSGVGNRGAHLGLDGGYRKGKMGFTLGGFLWSEYNVNGNYTNTQTAISSRGEERTVQSATTNNQSLWMDYKLGWDYDFDSTSFLNASISYNAENSKNKQNNLLTQTYLPSRPTPESGKRNVDMTDLSGTVDASLSYTKIYKPLKELTVMGLYSLNDRKNNFVTQLLDTQNGSTIGRIKNENPSYNQESTLQLDYQFPLGKTQLIEAGTKGIYRIVHSDYKYLVLQNGQYVIDNSSTSNVLSYNQAVSAVYFSHTLSTKQHYTFKTGVRYEYTSINASYESGGNALNSGLSNYGILVPSINVSKTLENGKTIKIGYNRRIQRPGIQFLNPNVNISNPNNITAGNPNLSPELSDNLELGLSGQIKAFYISASLFGRTTSKMITSVRDTISRVINGENTKIISTTYSNIGKEEAIGLNLFTNATLFNKWQIGLGGTVYQTWLDNQAPSLRSYNSGFVTSVFLNSDFNLGKRWTLQGFAGGGGRQIQLQGYEGGWVWYSLGIKRDFKNKRGSFGIAGENFFNHPFNVQTEVSSPILSQKSVNGMYNAGIKINFTYRIGRTGIDDQQGGRHRKSIKNDDVKGNSMEGNGNSGKRSN